MGGNLLEKQSTIIKRSFRSSAKLLSLDFTIPVDELTAKTFYHFRTSELFNIWTPPFCTDSSMWLTKDERHPLRYTFYPCVLIVLDFTNWHLYTLDWESILTYIFFQFQQGLKKSKSNEERWKTELISMWCFIIVRRNM